jgi:hypothetical protein
MGVAVGALVVEVLEELELVLVDELVPPNSGPEVVGCSDPGVVGSVGAAVVELEVLGVVSEEEEPSLPHPSAASKPHRDALDFQPNPENG